MNMQNNLSSASLNNIFTDWPNVVHQYFFTMMRNISPENYWPTIVPLLDQRWATLLQCYLTTLIIYNIFFLKMGQSCSNIVLSMLPCCQKITNRTLYQLCKTTLCNIVILKWQRCYNIQTTQIATWEYTYLIEFHTIDMRHVKKMEELLNINSYFSSIPVYSYCV